MQCTRSRSRSPKEKEKKKEKEKEGKEEEEGEGGEEEKEEGEGEEKEEVEGEGEEKGKEEKKKKKKKEKEKKKKKKRRRRREGEEAEDENGGDGAERPPCPPPLSFLQLPGRIAGEYSRLCSCRQLSPRLRAGWIASPALEARNPIANVSARWLPPRRSGSGSSRSWESHVLARSLPSR